MRWRDVAVVGGTALATALVALPILCVGYAIANDGAKAEIQWPVLRTNGAEITLRAEKSAYSAGETPVIQLVAANPSGTPVTLEAQVRMMAQPLPSMMMRAMPVARQRWEQRTVIQLGANEQKVIPLPTGTAAAAGSRVTFQLSVGTSKVTTPPITVPGGEPLLQQVVQQQVAPKPAPAQTPR